MDDQARIDDAVATAQMAAQLTKEWAVCDGCVHRLAECPSVNLSLERKGERQRRLNAWDGIEWDEPVYDTSSSNITWQELRSAAEQGCPLCEAARNRVREEINHPERSRQLLLDTIDLREERDYEQLRLLLEYSTGEMAGDQSRDSFANAEDTIQSVTLTFDRLHDAGELKILLEVLLRTGNTESGTTPLSVEALHWGLFPAEGSMPFPKTGREARFYY